MKHRKKIKNIIMLTLLVLLIPIIVFSLKDSKKASAINAPSYLTFENFNPNAGLGTKENPFIILEIVPYRGMGEIGYIVGGQEPVDPNVRPQNELYGTLNSIANGAFEIQADGSLKNTELFKKQVLNLSEEKCEDYYIRVVTITPDELNKNAAKFAKFYNLDDHGKRDEVKLKEHENEYGEIDLIGNADLISISTMNQSGSIPLWKQYGRDTTGISIPYDENKRGFVKEDLNWQTTMELFMKIGVVNESAPLICDQTCFTSPPGDSAKAGGNSNNVYKLSLMLRVMDPKKLYDLMNTNGGTEDSHIKEVMINKITTGSYDLLSGDAKIYWNENTFLPHIEGIDSNTNDPAYQKYLEEIGYISWLTGHSTTFVIRNVYFTNGNSSIVQYFTNYNNGNEIVRGAISWATIPYEYSKEFFEYLDIRNSPAKPTKASPCEAAEYILSRPKDYNKENITILDLEPCNDFTLNVSEVRQMLPGLTGVIRIEQQTTAEFIGKTEDLNDTYDMIFIGTRTGKMKTDGSGKTVYNDPKLDGYVYLHVGDRMVGYDTFLGNLQSAGKGNEKASDYVNLSDVTSNRNRFLKGYSSGLLNSADFYRYSGNDITSVKRDALRDYMAGGFPVLLENDLYTGNNEIVDEKSMLWEFLGTSTESYPNQTFNRKDLLDYSDPDAYFGSQKKLTGLLQKEKLSIDLIAAPVEYKEEDDSTLITDRTLRFRFRINPPTDSDSNDVYDWKLYVDVNADGKFSKGEEDEKNELIIGVTNVKAGEYSDSKKLPEEYTGVIPWKLEVVSRKNPNIRSAKTGFAAFKLPDMDEAEKKRTQIDVLQITSNDSTLNLEELMNPGRGKTSLFYQYTKDLDDFNVKIKTVNVNEFMSWYESGGNYDGSRPETDRLNNYDMLIFGFGDCYSDISNEHGALTNVQAFINSGRSVMFTHDTTSFVNLPKKEFESYHKDLTYWGYGFNRYVRSIAGLDRFNVLNQASVGAVYDQALIPDRIRAGLYKNSPLTLNAAAYPEIQGLTNGCLVAYHNPDKNPLESIYDANRYYPPFLTGNTIYKRTALDQYRTTFVTKVNEGQVTSYPYDIPDSFKISETHVQYYQINMDDPDIIVWFCLSDDKSNEYPGNESYKAAMDHSNETKAYSTSPNDVRNNYYIYSKGNIMYTGVGHSSMDQLVDVGKTNKDQENEVKLFINTMIASYSAASQPPTIEIIDAAVDSGGGFVLYDYSERDESLADDSQRIRFVPRDTNLQADNLVVRLYKVDNSGNREPISPDTLSVYDSRNNTAASKNTSGGNAGYNVVSDVEYYFDYPKTVLGGEGYHQLYFTVTNQQGQNGDANLKLLRRSLFNLD